MAILVNKIMLSSFILAIIFVTFMVGVESIFEVYEAKVLMTNKLSTPLTLHCKDKTHDDHINTLQPGESHRFKFVPNPFGTASLWFCSFNWTGAFHRFDIFVQKRDECHDCNWEIYTTGPCKLDPLVKCYPWYS
ncbi:putative plant self-incompatibility S1 [Lupinus albus]|uniref:S-protein homolog n=1 Tax=Lupinus albus TaxID=3870 RepID=A0A6A4QG89_LUPAL|nr:putative plant self-incompatibility S1 [Lupinus albus]KAE9612684.1 putative plant self-incompatibility S1 [Lupinus albus]KAE9612685.1 putative plant self-incompatibility S1 [Lupinus albus]